MQAKQEPEEKKNLYAYWYGKRPQEKLLTQIPESTVTKLVIPSNEYALGFKTDCYNEKFMNNRITKEQFTETVNEATSICTKFWRDQKQNDYSDPYEYEKKLLFFGIPLTLLSFILFSIRAYDKKNYDNQQLLYTGFALLILVAIFVIIAFLISINKSIQQNNLEKKTINYLRRYFNNQNKKIYENKNFKWKVGRRYFWLELHNLTR